MPVFASAITLKEETILADEDKKDRLSFNIIIDPAVAEDRTKIYVTRFGGGSAEDWLRFSSQANKMFQAKGWKQQAAQLFASYRLLLKDDAYDRFNTFLADEGGKEDMDSLKNILEKMTTMYLPHECARNTRRYLQQVHKSPDMKIKAFIARVRTINSYLPLMPCAFKCNVAFD